MGSRKGRARGPAHPYTHRRQRSGRSPALPYPPRRRLRLYHSLALMGQFSVNFITHIWSGFLNEATNAISRGFLREATGKSFRMVFVASENVRFS